MRAKNSIKNRVEPREVTLAGDLHVRRILPLRGGRMVGPFAFLDQMGPMKLAPGESGDVPPHPHIGLSTLTYLEEGILLHRDSLGTVQETGPGDLNWMTAGAGIAHSERIPQAIRAGDARFSGMQAWVALPTENEDDEASFQHIQKDQVPRFVIDGNEVVLIAGSAYGQTSPVRTFSPLFYFHARVAAGKRLAFDPAGQEIAVYVARGGVELDATAVQAPQLIELEAGSELELTATADADVFVLGGMPLAEPRYIWWNFVASSRERIETAKERWRNGEFPRVPGETEFVPLPESSKPSEKTKLP